MPPILTLGLEAGLIFGLAVWQARKLARTRRIVAAALADNEDIQAHPRGLKLGMAFLAFWLRCYGVGLIVWLLTVLTGWQKLGSWDTALNILGVLTTLAFGWGLLCGAWVFGADWHTVWQRFWADFHRPRPRRRRLSPTDFPDGETEPPFSLQDDVTLDLPPYHELNSPNSNSKLRWCEECGRWMGQQHRHDKVAV